jgi:hypothetical protein
MDEPFNEVLDKLNEQAIWSNAGNVTVELVADFVCHEADLLPLQQLAFRIVRPALPLGRVPGDLGELFIEFFSALIGDPTMPRLSQHAMHDEIRISADWRREMCIVLRRKPEVA